MIVNEPIGAADIDETKPFGCPYHGLVKDGMLTLSNGQQKPFLNQPTGSRLMYLSPPWAKGESGMTSAMADAEKRAGREWKNYGLISGQNSVFCGQPLSDGGDNVWLWAKAEGDVWKVSANTISFFSPTVTIDLTPFGKLSNDDRTAYQITIPMPKGWGEDKAWRSSPLTERFGIRVSLSDILPESGVTALFNVYVLYAPGYLVRTFSRGKPIVAVFELNLEQQLISVIATKPRSAISKIISSELIPVFSETYFSCGEYGNHSLEHQSAELVVTYFGYLGSRVISIISENIVSSGYANGVAQVLIWEISVLDTIKADPGHFKLHQCGETLRGGYDVPPTWFYEIQTVGALKTLQGATLWKSQTATQSCDHQWWPLNKNGLLPQFSARYEGTDYFGRTSDGSFLYPDTFEMSNSSINSFLPEGGARFLTAITSGGGNLACIVEAYYQNYYDRTKWPTYVKIIAAFRADGTGGAPEKSLKPETLGDIPAGDPFYIKVDIANVLVHPVENMPIIVDQGDGAAYV